MKLLQSILFSLLMGVAILAHAVSDEVRVDLLMSRITSALKAEKYADALPLFAELEGMEPSLQTPLPESFHFYYIDTLDKTGNIIKAHSRTEAYLNKYGKNGKYYGQVIEIMSRLQVQVDIEQEKLKKAAQQAALAAQRKAEQQRQQAEADQANKKLKDEWENKEPISQGGLTWVTGVFPSQEQNKVHWEEANSYCANTTIKGMTGWRLPKIDELRAFSDATRDQWIFFEKYIGFWSSTSDRGRAGSRHWFVSLNRDSDNYYYHSYDNDSLHVLCVR